MTFGINSTGFTLKRLADILAEITAELAVIQDPVTGETLTPDLADENDPLVQHVNAVADGLAATWEQLQLAYNQFDPALASGAGLSGLVQLNGITRRAGTRTTAVLTLTGTAGVSLVAGKQVSTMDDSVVFTLPAAVIGVGGTVDVVGTATEDGALEAGAGTVVKIVTPVAGWSAVTNVGAATVGTEGETDEELRARQQASTSASAQSIIESIYSAISNLEGVTYCRVYQNITLEADARGIPAKSIAVIVQGGDEDEIAEVIFNRNPLAGTFGTTTVTITDAQGFTYDVNFSRPVEVEIYVAVAVTVVNSALWPSDGDDRIKAAIVDFSTSGARALGVPLGYDQNGYIVGESVYASELYLPVGSVLGTKITEIVVGETAVPAPSADEVLVEWNEVAVFAIARIEVVVT